MSKADAWRVQIARCSERGTILEAQGCGRRSRNDFDGAGFLRWWSGSTDGILSRFPYPADKNMHSRARQTTVPSGRGSTSFRGLRAGVSSALALLTSLTFACGGRVDSKPGGSGGDSGSGRDSGAENSNDPRCAFRCDEWHLFDFDRAVHGLSIAVDHHVLDPTPPHDVLKCEGSTVVDADGSVVGYCNGSQVGVQTTASVVDGLHVMAGETLLHSGPLSGTPSEESFCSCQDVRTTRFSVNLAATSQDPCRPYRRDWQTLGCTVSCTTCQHSQEMCVDCVSGDCMCVCGEPVCEE